MKEKTTKNIEIEFKQLISQETYQQIIKDYQPYLIASYSQTNHYLLNDKLLVLKNALRIRVKNNHYELTYKERLDKGNLETNIQLTKTEYNQILNHQFPNNEIFRKLKSLGITSLNTDYSLTTLRNDYQLTNGILSLDYNQYLNHEDYEIEFEVTDYQQGLSDFQKISAHYNIAYKTNCPSKIQRVVNLLPGFSSQVK